MKVGGCRLSAARCAAPYWRVLCRSRNFWTQGRGVWCRCHRKKFCPPFILFQTIILKFTAGSSAGCRGPGNWFVLDIINFIQPHLFDVFIQIILWLCKICFLASNQFVLHLYVLSPSHIILLSKTPLRPWVAGKIGWNQSAPHVIFTPETPLRPWGAGNFAGYQFTPHVILLSENPLLPCARTNHLLRLPALGEDCRVNKVFSRVAQW